MNNIIVNDTYFHETELEKNIIENLKKRIVEKDEEIKELKIQLHNKLK